MTDYQATLAQWAECEEWATSSVIGASDACILELRARVEALEAKYETQRATTLEWGKDLENLQRWNDQHLRRIEELEADRWLRQHAKPKQANSKPTPNPSQIRSSLVERVHSCIVGEPECGHMQARAAIREVAAWLREHAGGTRAAWLLDNEAE